MVRLHTTQKVGQSLADHLAHVEKATGKRPEEAEAAQPPWAAEYLFHWFWDLHGGRGAGMSGPLPLTWTEIKSW